MDVRTSGADDFRRLAAKFRAAGKDGAAIRLKLTKTIQKRLERITSEQKAAALAMNVKGVKGAGTARRQSFHEAARLRGRNVRKRKGGYGLRASTAHAIKSKVNYTGRKLGARVYVDASGLPPSQRKLPRHLDNPRGWRHPVYGNRAKWVRQVGEPYFSKPIERHREQTRREVKSDVDEVMRTLK
jgi:hypothetical protein